MHGFFTSYETIQSTINQNRLIGIVVVPLLVSVVWRKMVGPCDYIAQGGLFLLTLLLFFLTPLQTGVGKGFKLCYRVGLIWGLWRLFYFDAITSNDIPGIAYFTEPLMLGGISSVIFLIRKGVVHQTSGKSP